MYRICISFSQSHPQDVIGGAGILHGGAGVVFQKSSVCLALQKSIIHTAYMQNTDSHRDTQTQSTYLRGGYYEELAARTLISYFILASQSRTLISYFGFLLVLLLRHAACCHLADLLDGRSRRSSARVACSHVMYECVRYTYAHVPHRRREG